MIDPYETLGIDASASPSEIKRAYRQKMREAHTDISDSGSHARAALVNEAYEALRDGAPRVGPDREDAHANRPAPQSTWGAESSWTAPTEERSTEAEGWGRDETWSERPAPRRTRWSHDDDRSTRRRLSRLIWIFGAVAGVLGAVCIMLAVMSIVVASTYWVGNALIYLILVGLASLLVFRRTYPVGATIVSTVVVALTVLGWQSSGWWLSLFLAAFFGSAIVAGVIRRRRIAYLRDLALSQGWEEFQRSCAAAGVSPLWISQALYRDHSTRTYVQVWDPVALGWRSIWIWGAYPPQVWVCYEEKSQSATAWIGDGARESWTRLDARARHR